MCAIPDSAREALAEQNAQRESARAIYRKPGETIPRSPETVKRQSARRRQAYCHRAVQRALETGKLQKPPRCHFCKEPPAEAHHLSYEEPLDVIWLCERHHDIFTAGKDGPSLRITRAYRRYR